MPPTAPRSSSSGRSSSRRSRPSPETSAWPSSTRGQGASPAYVALVPGDRYRLVERDDGPPAVGVRIVVEEDAFQIVRLGSSPLPGDRRRCAFLELDLAY